MASAKLAPSIRLLYIWSHTDLNRESSRLSASMWTASSVWMPADSITAVLPQKALSAPDSSKVPAI